MDKEMAGGLLNLVRAADTCNLAAPCFSFLKVLLYLICPLREARRILCVYSGMMISKAKGMHYE